MKFWAAVCELVQVTVNNGRSRWWHQTENDDGAPVGLVSQPQVFPPSGSERAQGLQTNCTSTLSGLMLLFTQHIQTRLIACSDLPRLSLLGAGTSVSLVRQGSLSLPAPGHVRRNGPLLVLPVAALRLVVSPALSCTLLPPLLGRRALFVVSVGRSVSGGSEEETSHK